MSDLARTVRTGPPPKLASRRKWHPGQYALQTSISSYVSADLTEIGAMAHCIGWKQRTGWSTIETARGVYSWTFLDTLLALCRQNGKQLVIEIASESYDNTNPLPAYLATEPNGGGGWYSKVNTLGVQSKVYLPAIMARLMALATAIAARYDSDPNFEGIVFQGESSLPEATLQSDYSESKWLTQYLSMVSQLPTIFKQSLVWTGLNFGFPTLQNFVTITAAMRASGCGATGPDSYISSTDNTTNGDHALRGLIPVNNSTWTTGGVDCRGVIPIAHDTQGPELGGKENPSTGTTIAVLYSLQYNTHQDNHSFWLKKQFTIAPTPPNDIYWDNTKGYAGSPLAGSQDIKSFINAGNPTRLTYPSALSATSAAALLFSEDFTTGYAWGALPMTSQATAIAQLGAHWPYIDWATNHGAIDAWPPNAAKDAFRVQYVNSDDLDVMQYQFLPKSSARPAELYIQWMEYRSATFDFGPSKDFRVTVYQQGQGSGGTDPFVDVYGGFVNPAASGVGDCTTATLNIQGVGVAQPGDPNVITSANYILTRATAHKVEVHIKINTPGNADGSAEMWVDGVQILSRTNVKFTPDTWTQGQIEGVQLGMTATNGGIAFAASSYIWRTDFKLSASYIG